MTFWCFLKAVVKNQTYIMQEVLSGREVRTTVNKIQGIYWSSMWVSRWNSNKIYVLLEGKLNDDFNLYIHDKHIINWWSNGTWEIPVIRRVK
jgi:hypothetical protein